MIQQTVDWSYFPPEMSRLFWRTYFYRGRGGLGALVFLIPLTLLDVFYLKSGLQVWILASSVIFFVAMAIISYRRMRNFGREIKQSVYSIDEKELKVNHAIAEVTIPLTKISKVISFPEGVYVQYGPRLMLTLPNGPVQQALSQRFRS